VVGYESMFMKIDSTGSLQNCYGFDVTFQTYEEPGAPLQLNNGTIISVQNDQELIHFDSAGLYLTRDHLILADRIHKTNDGGYAIVHSNGNFVKLDSQFVACSGPPGNNTFITYHAVNPPVNSFTDLPVTASLSDSSAVFSIQAVIGTSTLCVN